MARYRGPKSKIARKFKEPIFGPDKVLEKKPYPPGMHGASKDYKEIMSMAASQWKEYKEANP